MNCGTRWGWISQCRCSSSATWQTSPPAIWGARCRPDSRVSVDMRRRLPASLELTVSALCIALLLAVPLGVAAALRPGSPVDHVVRMLCTLGVCVPTFVSGLLLIYVFYYLLGLAPDPTARIDIFASSPPDITGFLPGGLRDRR